MNGFIRVPRVRVVDAAGQMLGEMDTAAALSLAEEAALDLVEVSPDADPPVCRIMDFRKVQFEKKKKSAGPKPRKTQLKQIRIRAKIGQHDLDVKVQQAREFLERRDKVKFNVVFRGRENAHHDRGRELLASIIEQLASVSTVEQFPRMETGRSMSTLLAPSGKGPTA